MEIFTANKKIQLTVGSADRFQRSFLYQNLVLCQSSPNICQRPLILALSVALPLRSRATDNTELTGTSRTSIIMSLTLRFSALITTVRLAFALIIVRYHVHYQCKLPVNSVLNCTDKYRG